MNDKPPTYPTSDFEKDEQPRQVQPEVLGRKASDAVEKGAALYVVDPGIRVPAGYDSLTDDY